NAKQQSEQSAKQGGLVVQVGDAVADRVGVRQRTPRKKRFGHQRISCGFRLPTGIMRWVRVTWCEWCVTSHTDSQGRRVVPLGVMEYPSLVKSISPHP